MQTEKENIIMAGVRFMAETAVILSGKKVFMPELQSSCPMASMCTRETVLQAKKRHPRAKVVMYVNTTADTKTTADIICTSANAARIVESLDADEILFAPDSNMASFLSRTSSKTILPVPSDGHCPTHAMLSAHDVRRKKDEHPDAEVLVHPECKSEVADIADRVLGTGGMVARVRESQSQSFIIGTEGDMLHRLKKVEPRKEFIQASEYLVCPSMKMHTQQKIAHQMMTRSNAVTIPPKVAERARAPLLAMLEVK